MFPETMSVFGNRWAAALLLAAFLGTTRFTDFQGQLGAPPSLLAERLQTFCSIGVFATSPAERTGPERAAYLLTDKGRAFFPVLVAALQWAQWWFHAPEGPAIVLTHHDCGAAVHRRTDLRPVRRATDRRPGRRRHLGGIIWKPLMIVAESAA